MLSGLSEVPVLGILRGVSDEALIPLAEATLRGGLRVLELAMNTEDADAKLARLCAVAGGRLEVGAGTVTDLQTLDRALVAGARFIVMPGLIPEVVTECTRRGVPVVPGAFTPTEVFLAHRAGAALVKVFPARTLGTAFFRELRGPLPHVPLLACGGVDEQNAAEWFRAGAAAVAVGASSYRQDWIEARRWDLIEARLKAIASAATAAKR
jgi:2-dehydro-3-deoxyphosphogluconate aldolase / (4S)-4-hydroxy-2-oxoglutarate aldolase